MLLPLRHHIIFSVFLILGLVFTEFLWANESESDTDDTIYRVKEVELDVGGRTQDRVIDRLAQFYPGQEFGSQMELDLYLADRVQELINQRPLAEASIEYELGLPENNIIPVTVFVRTRDSGIYSYSRIFATIQMTGCF